MAKVLSDWDAALLHKYRCVAGGPFVPGVTTVIGDSNVIRALPWKAAEIAAEFVIEYISTDRIPLTKEQLVSQARGEFDRVWRAKAARGTRVHEVAERWTRGETVDVSLEDSGFVDALELFHKEVQPRFKMAEKVVLNPHMLYGGRFDFLAEIDRVMTLGDFKTGGRYPYETALQAAAYMKASVAQYDASGTLTGTNWDSVGEMAEQARTIYLHEDGTYEVVDPFEHVSQADATVAFFAALELYKAKQVISSQLKGTKEDGRV